MLIDSHCHLDDYEDLAAVLDRASAAGVTKMLAIGIGNGPSEMHIAVDIAHQHPQVFASVGVHPQEAHQVNAETLARMATLAQSSRVLAIGEIGLDYYHAANPEIQVQQAAFVSQMHLAAQLRKPIIIHCRTSELATPEAKRKFEQAGNPQAAWDDLLALLHEHWAPTRLPGIMHCFSGNEQQAQASLELGFYLSFAGNLTYPKSSVIQQVAASAPADRILVETDAPFLTPVPLRGQRNEPAHVALTASFLAQLRNTTAGEVAELTSKNFHTLFAGA